VLASTFRPDLKKKEGNKEALPWMSWEIGANSDHEYFFSWQSLAI
jgi:hypothetical protein